MDFHGIDLNLLVAFDALMNERHVTRAATRVGVSQPASAVAGQLAVFPPPVALPEITFHLLWHRRADANPAQRWFRGLIETTAAGL